MKRAVILFILLNVLIVLIAPQSSSQNSSQDFSANKIWILFKDRPFLTGRNIHPASAVRFTDASLRRRAVRGEGAFDESDYPVDPAYVKSMREAGATVLVESRWLNGVSARCNHECRTKLAALPFVQEVRPVVVYRRKNEEITPVARLISAAAKRLNYGQSKDQLTQLQVPDVHKKGFTGQGEIVAIFDSGFRKDHEAFKKHTIIAERDFVFKDDNVTNGGSTDGHGTGTWSCVGGEVPGTLYGPAFQADFILAATEDIRSETEVEEDNWVEAFEWADQLGASVISSSLGYSDWYVPSDMNGTTAITSKVASKASKKGIVVVNSAGNSGPASSTLSAPADAKKILTVGAVDLTGQIANFSSRGPTADGRTKPEVVARGVDTFVAASYAKDGYGQSNGTSFSCPLTAGVATVLLSAHRDWKPGQIREALMMTASQAATPDNTYGWGIVNLFAALDYLPKKSVVIDEHKPLKNTTNNTTQYRASARIRAQRGINPNQLFLFWRLQGTSIFQQIALSAVADKPDYFEGFIPAQPAGVTVEYYLLAKDVKGKKTKLPVDAPAAPFSFNVK